MDNKHNEVGVTDRIMISKYLLLIEPTRVSVDEYGTSTYWFEASAVEFFNTCYRKEPIFQPVKKFTEIFQKVNAELVSSKRAIQAAKNRVKVKPKT